MGTIASLNIRAAVEPDGVRAGLQEALAMVEDWSRDVTQVVQQTKLKVPPAEAEKAAIDLITGLRRAFDDNESRLRENLFRGLVAPQEAQAIGLVNAAEFNHGLLQGIDQLASSGQLTTKIRGMLAGNLKMEGLTAGNVLRDQISESLMGGLNRAQPSLRAMTGNLRTMGSVGVNAAQQIARGMEQVAAGASKTEVGVRSITNTVGDLAVYFGTGGIIVAGIATVANSMYQLWRNTQKQIEETRKKFVEEIQNMVRAADQLGLVTKLQKIEIGDPAAGRSLISDSFKGSKRDLETALAGVTRQIDALEASVAGLIIIPKSVSDKLKPLVDRQKELTAALKPLRKEWEDLTKVINEPVRVPNPITGLRPMTISEKDPFSTKKGPDLLKKEFSELSTAVGIVVKRVSDIFDGTADAADSLKGYLSTWEKVTLAIDKARNQIERLQLKGLRDQLADAMVTPEMKRASADIGKNVGDAIQKRIDAITPKFDQGSGKLDLSIAGQQVEGTGNFKAPKELAAALESAARHTRYWQQAGDDLFDFLSKRREQIGVREESLKAQFTQPANTIKNIQQSAAEGALNIAEQLSPLGMAATALGAIFEGLQPAVDALKEPLRIVGEILGKALTPILKALFPIFKGVAIAATYIGEIIFRVSGGIAIAVGTLIRGIGNLLNKLPGSIGNPLKKFGQGLIDFGKAEQEAAHQLKLGRKELENLEWGTALDPLKDAAQKAADALLNVPIGWNAALRALQAGRIGALNLPSTGLPTGNIPEPAAPPPPPAPTTGNGSGQSFDPNLPVGAARMLPVSSSMSVEAGAIQINGVNKSPRDLAIEVLAGLRQLSLEQFGTTARWAEVT